MLVNKGFSLSLEPGTLTESIQKYEGDREI